MRQGRVRLRTLILLFAATALLAAGGLHAYGSWSQRRAVGLALKAQTARATVACTGVVVTRTYTPSGPVTSRARVLRGEGRMDVEFLAGPAQGVAVLRDGRRIWRRRGGRPRDLVMETSQEAIDLDEDLLKHNYIARILGSGQMAGRSVSRLALRHRWGRGGLQIWIDHETFFPLRIITIDPHGRAVSDTRYESIEYHTPPPPPASGPPPPPGLRMRPIELDEAQQVLGFTVLRPSYLPRGFRREAPQLHEFRGPRPPAIELRYTDGLNMLSIVEMKPPARGQGARRGAGANGGRGRAGRGMGPGARRPGGAGGRGSPGLGGRGSGPDGAPRRFEPMGPPGGRPVRRVYGDVTVIVMGDLPPAELERVADSLR